MAFGFHFKTPHLGIREHLSSFRTKTASFFACPFRRFRAWRCEKAATCRDFSDSRFGRFVSRTGRIVRRITQCFFVLVCLGIVALGIGVGALYYFVTPQTAQDALSRFAREALNAQVTLSGPVSLKRFPDLVIDFPKLQLTRLDGTDVLADIDSTQAHISLWSLPLGVVRVQDLTISGLKTYLSQDSFFGDDAFKEAFGATRFPDGLRIKNVCLKNSSVRVLANSDVPTVLFDQLNLTLGVVSPEMETPLEASFHVSEITDGRGASSPIGTLSLKTSLQFSASASALTLRDIAASGTLASTAGENIVLASAKRLRLTPSQVSGLALKASVCASDQTRGEVTLDVVDFLADASRLATPEIKLTYRKALESAQADLTLSAGININCETNAIDVTNISGSVSIPGIGATQTPLTATVKGKASGSTTDERLVLDLVGAVGPSAFTYEGSAEWDGFPRLAGTIRVADVNLESLPDMSDASWLNSADFTGEIRIGKLRLASLTAEQLTAKLKLTAGTLYVTDAVSNVAGGRVESTAQLSDDAKWSWYGTCDACSVEGLFAESADPVPMTGTLTAQLSLSGRGADPEILTGGGKIRILQGQVRGIDISQARTRTPNDTEERLATDFDEITGDISVSGQTLSVSNLVARNASSRLSGALAVQLTEKTLSGTAQVLRAPGAQVTPGLLTVGVTGSITHPTWTIESPDQIKNEKSPASESLTKRLRFWKNIRDFFKF